MASSTSGMIRPVCRSLPSSVSLWDDTNLPLSCVLQPLAGSSEKNQQSSKQPQLLASIPKCLHCGAPHPTSTSHYPLVNSLLCHLCGKTSSTRLEQQSERRHDELLEESGYRSGGSNSKQVMPASSVSGQVVEYALPMSPSSQEVNVLTCPPLWWIVVEGSPSRTYWNAISSVLQSVVAKLPSYVHVGLCMASSSTLSLWNLTSSVPLVQHYAFASSSNAARIPMADVGTYQSHMEAALRAMGDSLVATQGGVPMVKVLELIMDQLTNAQHPGQKQQPKNKSKGGSSDKARRPYAGGRVLFLLNGPPQELSGTATKSTTTTNSTSRGMGGCGGACFEPGLRFSATAASETDDAPSLQTEDDPEMGSNRTASASSKSKKKVAVCNTDDLTAKNLEQHYAHIHNKATVMKQFLELGQQFAEAAVGIDILVVRDPNINEPIGVPLLKPLTEPTGAPGPILLDLDGDKSLIESEIWSRRPSNSFGGLLRIRLSPGFKVDTSPLDAASRSPLELAPLHVRQGLMGCAAAAAKEDALWHVATCDATQAMTVDLQVTNKMKRFSFIEGMGEVALKSCMQVCFAYTTIVPSSSYSSDDNQGYVTVRRMRICTLHLPMVNDVESLYAALDPEALSVVLFQKMAMAAFTEQIQEVQDTGRNWLKYIMTCAYRSAENAEKRQTSNSAQGIESDLMFYPSERLLDQEQGQLIREEVLLGQGHEILRVLPLLVWCTLQCDPIRQSSETYRPNLDARCAALMQMTSMSPLVLARCIAPRLELWQSGKDSKESIVSAMGLSMEDIAVHLMEHQQTDPNLILFLDAPFGILVCDSRHLRAAQRGSSSISSVVVSSALEEAIEQARGSYRTPPPVTYALDLNTPISHLWKDVLMEDAVSMSSMQNFAQWKKEVAAAVYESLAEDADY
jgi:hypothetical protein